MINCKSQSTFSWLNMCGLISFILSVMSIFVIADSGGQHGHVCHHHCSELVGLLGTAASWTMGVMMCRVMMTVVVAR